MELTLLWAALIAAIPTGLAIRRLPLPDSRPDLADQLLGAVMVGLLTGRLAAMIGNGVNPLTNLTDVIIVRSGVATGWAASAAIIWLAWAGRPDWRGVLDRSAPFALLALAGWQAGCLVRDACLGAPSDLPWAVALGGSEITRHPVEIYAALALLVAAIGLWWAGRASAILGAGRLAGLALAAAAGIRLATEPLRPALGAGPVLWYWAAVAAGLGLAILGPRLSRPAQTT